MYVLTAAGLLACHDHAPAPPPIAEDAVSVACPTNLDMQLIGTESRFDPGYSGLAFGVGLPTGANLTVETYDCDPACRRCKFHGPVRPDPALEPVIAQRCLDDTPTICAQDSDCTGGKCRFMFPPISSTLVFPTCNLAYLEPVAGAADPSPVQGVFDLATGEMDLQSLNIFVSVTLGACDVCANDSAAFDGVAAGSCTVAGSACDVAGVGAGSQSLTSFDCPIATPLTQLALPGTFATTASKRWSMTPTDTEHPRCTGSGAAGKKPCWCGVCTDGTPCTADFECASGACAAKGPGSATHVLKNNACGSGCLWDDATQTGRCADAPATPCFPDSGDVVATGVAEKHDGFYISQVANLECMPSFGSAAIDGVAGFPGPLLFQARFRVSTRTTH